MGPEDDSQSYEINKGNVNISNHYFGGHFRWTEAAGDEPKTTEEAQERIDKLYESGVPFFSKEMIRFAFEQCQRKPPRGEMLYTKDITGAMVEFESQTGDVKKENEEDGDEVEYILLDPVLSYDCRAHLKHHLWWTGISEDRPPFCSLTIQHPSLKFKTKTKEPVNPWPTQPREKVSQIFKGHCQDWRDTEVPKKLVQTLTMHTATHQITKIVGLALGAISYDYDDGPRSYIQHALLLMLGEWLRERSGKEDVKCYAQDPGYRSVDSEVLKEHGIEVINDPRAWLEIDDESIVFSVSPNVPVKEIVADIARPAVIIWERVGFEDADQEGKRSR
ncbi:hypothetical protein PMG11_07358 [Penicillium brasilianum]|uniref:SRR1-like domain-containing protein n=1 Tax=Penicillium brasilianum TaxID=104259 RepID=A0A0F7TTG9_PENBI|nr:hypothetical protein PMG11_07358 [Penicillium brasilianum]